MVVDPPSDSATTAPAPSDLTIAIPCRDAGPYLEPLLRSLLAQTARGFSLLMVDDASTDDSVDVARRVAGERLRIERNQTRRGIAANWNRCAELVETPFFCLAHMDDRYAPTFAERMLRAFGEHPEAGAVHARARAIDSQGRGYDAAPELWKDKFWDMSERDEPAALYRSLYEGNWICCPSLVYRKDVFDAVGGFRESLAFAMDWDLMFRILASGRRIVGVDEVLIAYRRHPDSATCTAVRSYDRYREELEVLGEAREAGIRAGFLSEDWPPSRAVRNNLLVDVHADLNAGDAAAARDRLEFAIRHVPGFRRDPLACAVRLAVRLGPVGKRLLDLGLGLVVRMGPRLVRGAGRRR